MSTFTLRVSIGPLGIFNRLVGIRRCLLLPHRSPSFRHTPPSAGQTSLTINRTHKSDRMPLVPATTRNAGSGPVETNAPPGTPGPEPPRGRRMRADGERIGQSALAQIAGRCVSYMAPVAHRHFSWRQMVRQAA